MLSFGYFNTVSFYCDSFVIWGVEMRGQHVDGTTCAVVLKVFCSIASTIKKKSTQISEITALKFTLVH